MVINLQYNTLIRMEKMTSKYQNNIDNNQIDFDPCQYEAISVLSRIAEQLERDKTAAVNGVYIWGEVGRGKTYLMDMFYDSIKEPRKMRLHFHHFMAKMHQELNHESGHSEPLRRIAYRLAKQCRVLCFDEFFVSDIGDAMILGRLFEALFEQGVTLVAPCNIAINDLYQGGLQRQRFEPTIALLLKYTTEFHLNGAEDHRLRCLTHQSTYFGLEQYNQFKDCFNHLVIIEQCVDKPVSILGREIMVIKRDREAIWFRFDDLCNGPRSTLDYIDLAKRFKHVFIGDVPELGGECRGWIRARGTEDGSVATATGERTLNYAVQDDAARRFISLVDELYDQNVNLYICANVTLDQLYSGGALSFEFKRTFSRLTEMKSLEYLSKH